MLFRKKMEKFCSYCAYGTTMSDNTVICSKRGIQKPESHCWRFRYDPCKRIPSKMKALDFSRFHTEDFSL